jgi:broad specificity phosphatase PhoE
VSSPGGPLRSQTTTGPATAPDMSATELWMVRHGETDWSASGQHTSVTELPLRPSGAAVAAALAPRLASESFALVLTSPRERARHTAELAGYPDAVVDEDLAEWGYGDYEGLTTEEIRRQVPGWTVWTHPTPGGETAGQVTARLARVLARVRAVDGKVLAFGHGHALRAMAALWIEQPVEEGRFLALDTGTVSVLDYERERPVVRRWNA